MGQEQRCPLARQGLPYGLWQQVRGSCHSPHAVPLQTWRGVISRCGFTEVGKGAVTLPIGPTPWSLCGSLQIMHPPSSSATCSLPGASEAKGNRSAMQQVDKCICAHTYVCAMYTHVRACTGILPPGPRGSLHGATSQAGHKGTEGE